MKEFKITSAEIRVSPNNLCESGYFADLHVVGIFPGCRKPQTVSFSPSASQVVARPLFGYHGLAVLRPEVFAAFVKSLPVVACKHDHIEITPMLADWARKQCNQMADCAAVTNLKDVCPQYLESLRYDRLEVTL